MVREKDHLPVKTLLSGDIGLAEAAFAPGSGYSGRTLRDIRFRRRYGVNVVGIFRKGRLMRTALADEPLRDGDVLLFEGRQKEIEELEKQAELRVSGIEKAHATLLEERLMLLQVPPDSGLVGKTLSQSRLGDALQLSVIGLYRAGRAIVPDTGEVFQAHDRLVVEGKQEEMKTLQALQELEIEQGRRSSHRRVFSRGAFGPAPVLAPFALR